jgi:CheY-like chemotaxis protein
VPALPDDDTQAVEKPVILVVEDHPGVRAFTGEVLFPFYRVLQAANGAEGIGMARESIPDLILSDVMMPVMDGYTFLHLVKTDELTCHIPVVLLTARNSAASRLEGLDTGADAYLAKPFHVQELLLIVRNLLNLRQKIQQQLIQQQFAGQHPVGPEQTAPQTPDESFLQRFTGLVDAHLSEESFGVEAMCEHIGMSRTQLHRKVKAVTGHSTSHLMRTIRLQRALEMLHQDDLSIADIAFRVGFNSPSYFTESFHKHFGYPPSEARK